MDDGRALCSSSKAGCCPCHLERLEAKLQKTYKKRKQENEPTLRVPHMWKRAREQQELLPPNGRAFAKVRLRAKAAHTLNRSRVLQFSQCKPCPLPGCRKLTSRLHGRTTCDNVAVKNMRTDIANKAVHSMARYIAAGQYGRWTLLINAGTKYAANGKEDDTVPEWMLPRAPGGRGYPDKPDMVLVIGWDKGTPPPQPGTPGVKLMFLEHCFAHDFYYKERRSVKRAKYARLITELEEAGWTVVGDAQAPDGWYDEFMEEGELRPSKTAIHTFVQGHMASFAACDEETLKTFGVDSTDVHKVLTGLYKIAVYGLHMCAMSYFRACKTGGVVSGLPRAGMG
jgi:hypothetical protein